MVRKKLQGMEPAKRSLRINLVLCTWLLITLTLHQLVQVNGMSMEEAVPLSVNRRVQDADILILTNSTHHRNCYAHTYLVDERRCVDNQVLHDGTHFMFYKYQYINCLNIWHSLCSTLQLAGSQFFHTKILRPIKLPCSLMTRANCKIV